MPARIPRWLLCMILVSPGWYLASAQGAEDRARLAGADSAIARAHGDIRMLETEFAARANLGQLERWNSQGPALASPRADQFVSETALAALDPQLAQPDIAIAAAPRRPRAPQVAMLDPTLPGDAAFDGLRSVGRGEGRGLR